MTTHINIPALSNAGPQGSTYFAQTDDQDLEFDETFDDDEFDSGGKPPNKRPYFLILAIVLIGALVYFALDLQLFSSIGNMIVSPSQTVQPEKKPSAEVAAPSSTPTPQPRKPADPRFAEGQMVSLVTPATVTSSTIHLKNSPGGLQQGEPVHAGDHLTILDGAFVNNRWIYQVKTPSGTTGWIEERYLKAAS